MQITFKRRNRVKALIISLLLLASTSAFASEKNSAGSSTRPCRPGEWYWNFVDNGGNGAGERVTIVCKNGKYVPLLQAIMVAAASVRREFTLDTGHTPFLTDPHGLALNIEMAAKPQTASR
jgi:hypothetical protein